MVLTKMNLKKRGVDVDTKCSFCGEDENIDHLFVTCSFIQTFWQWISQFHGFVFQGENIEQLWSINAGIPPKDSRVVEAVRGAILWVVWLERNNITFRNKTCRSFKSLGTQIIKLVSLWCEHHKKNLFLKLSLVMPLDVNELPSQLGLVDIMQEDRGYLFQAKNNTLYM